MFFVFKNILMSQISSNKSENTFFKIKLYTERQIAAIVE